MTTVNEPQIPAGFSARLRAQSLEHHRATESSGFLATLVGGGLARDGYAVMVAQHWFIYQALEQAAEAMRGDPVAGGFVADGRRGLHRLPALRADLAFLLGPDWPDRIELIPATAAYRDRIGEICSGWPAGFIAHHYTRYLGDLSGGQRIRRALVRRYGLSGRQGVAFYDFPDLGPVPAFKRGYRARLDALPYPPAELARLVGEVRTAYYLNTLVFEDLAQHTRQYVDPFPAGVVAQIMRHMNDDHAADSLLIVRALGDRPGAVGAVAVRMSGMDVDGIDFQADLLTGETGVPVRVPFARRLTRRAEVRPEVVRLFREACARLG